MLHAHPTKRCDTCEFWAPGDQWPVDEEEDPDDQEGACRRHAPHPSLGEWEHEVMSMLSIIAWTHAPDEQKETEFRRWEQCYLQTCTWPGTTGSDWCGDWALRTRPLYGQE